MGNESACVIKIDVVYLTFIVHVHLNITVYYKKLSIAQNIQMYRLYLQYYIVVYTYTYFYLNLLITYITYR